VAFSVLDIIRADYKRIAGQRLVTFDGRTYRGRRRLRCSMRFSWHRM